MVLFRNNYPTLDQIEQTQQIRQPASISSKRLHFYVITRLDISDNNLEFIPFTIFQIESLKYLKLSANRIKQLPVNQNQFDDVNKKHRLRAQDNKPGQWNCHCLEELDLENNHLTNLTCQIFQIKSLRHLNVSQNRLDTLPEELWTAPALIELNAAFNRISRLPIASKKSIQDNYERNSNNNEVSVPVIRRHNEVFNINF